MNLTKNKRKLLIIYISILLVVVIIIFCIFLLDKSEPSSPEVGLLKIGNHTLIVNPSEKYLSEQEKNSSNEQLVYCLNSKENSETCSWQNSPKFQIEYDHTYYVYIKSLNTNLISEPKTINYPNPNDTNIYKE